MERSWQGSRERLRGGERAHHPPRMKSWNGQARGKAGEEKETWEKKRGGRERKDAGPARRVVPVLVGSRRIWFSHESLVTDTEPE